MSQLVKLPCPACQQEFELILAELVVFNAPTFSCAVITHERAQTCPQCLKVSGIVIQQVNLNLGLQLLESAPAQIIVPNGRPNLPM